jgi:hypothetical protein
VIGRRFGFVPIEPVLTVSVMLLNVSPSTLQDVAVPPPTRLKVMGFPVVCPAREVAAHGAPHAGEPTRAVVISAATALKSRVFVTIASHNLQQQKLKFADRAIVS